MELQLKHSLFCFETMLLLLFKSCTKTGAENGFLKYMENMLRLLSLKVNNSCLSDNSIENHGPSVRSIYEKYAMHVVMRTTAGTRVLLAI